MNIELRTDSVIIDGYVNAVERESRPLKSPTGEFVEVIKAGAFKNSLKRKPDVDLLLNHDDRRKLGSTKDKTLELYEDNIGLRAICTIRDHFVITKAQKGQLKGWSFGFTSKTDRVDTLTVPNKRYVEELELFEVSIIDNTMTPAYPSTSIEMRNGQEYLKEVRILKSEKSDIDYEKYKNTVNELKGGQ